MVSRRRTPWRWSAHINGKPTRGEHNRAGVVHDLSSSGALEAVARELGCLHRPQQFHYWATGGWSTYTNDHADTVTVLVVAGEDSP